MVSTVASKQEDPGFDPFVDQAWVFSTYFVFLQSKDMQTRSTGQSKLSIGVYTWYRK